MSNVVMLPVRLSDTEYRLGMAHDQIRRMRAEKAKMRAELRMYRDYIRQLRNEKAPANRS